MNEVEYTAVTTKVRLELILNQLRDLAGYHQSSEINKATQILFREYTKLSDIQISG
jgi:hypothetical protein